MDYVKKMYESCKRLYYAGVNAYGYGVSYNSIGWTVLVFRSKRERDNYIDGRLIMNKMAEPLTKQKAVRAGHGKEIYPLALDGTPYHAIINGCIGELRSGNGNYIAKI